MPGGCGLVLQARARACSEPETLGQNLLPALSRGAKEHQTRGMRSGVLDGHKANILIYNMFSRKQHIPHLNTSIAMELIARVWVCCRVIPRAVPAATTCAAPH